MINKLKALLDEYPTTAENVGIGALLEVWECLPELLAVVEAAKDRTRHSPTCRLSWSMTDHDSACSCGATKLKQTLAALNTKRGDDK